MMIGQKISQYKILEKLGQVGMGVVYNVEDAKPNHTVALSFLPSELICDKEGKEGFAHRVHLAHCEILYEHGVGGRGKVYEAGDTNLDLSLP